MVGIYLLPLMLFHAIQLLIVSHLAELDAKSVYQVAFLAQSFL